MVTPTASEIPVRAVRLEGRVVVLVGQDTGVARGLESALAAAGGRVAWLRPAGGPGGTPSEDGTIDMSNRKEVFRSIDAVGARLGSVDGLVFAWFSDAATRPVPVATMDDGFFGTVWEAPMEAALFCFQAVYRHFREGARGGTLVAVVPTIAMSGGPNFAASAAAAEGQRLLIKSAARQWGPEGVTANTVAVAPGLVIPDPPNFEQSLAERALGRLGDPESDIGPIVAFLSSGAARFLTGSTLFADGGLWMSAP